MRGRRRLFQLPCNVSDNTRRLNAAANRHTDELLAALFSLAHALAQICQLSLLDVHKRFVLRAGDVFELKRAQIDVCTRSAGTFTSLPPQPGGQLILRRMRAGLPARDVAGCEPTAVFFYGPLYFGN